MKKKLLLIHKAQFGYHNNAYKHCLYLKDNFDILFLSPDSGRKKISMDGISVIYIKDFAGKYGLLYTMWRKISFMVAAIFLIFFSQRKVIVYYFQGCDWLKRIFKNRNMLLDIRTFSVSDNYAYNIKSDERLRSTAELYDIITVLSRGMKNKLCLNNKKLHIVPLGADVISKCNKQYEIIKLLYVGTLQNRNIDLTIEGLSIFLKNNPNAKIEYHIVGEGNTASSLNYLKDLAKMRGIDNIVYFYGRVPNVKLGIFFDNCNIGVSFVPITEYYNFQPVTKTFEYAMSGLFVIGTRTYENAQVINKKNGILISDTADSFCEALEYIQQHIGDINEEEIRESLVDFSWNKIVENKLIPIINTL